MIYAVFFIPSSFFFLFCWHLTVFFPSAYDKILAPGQLACLLAFRGGDILGCLHGYVWYVRRRLCLCVRSFIYPFDHRPVLPSPLLFSPPLSSLLGPLFHVLRSKKRSRPFVQVRDRHGSEMQGHGMRWGRREEIGRRRFWWVCYKVHEMCGLVASCVEGWPWGRRWWMWRRLREERGV